MPSNIKATFGGVKLTGDVSFTLKLGTKPSTGSISVPSNIKLPNKGNLVLSDGTKSITIKELYLVEPVYSEADGGAFTQATIADRRILWANSGYFLTYNTPDADNKPTQEKTLEQILTECFQWLNETKVRFFALPEVYPPVEGDGQPIISVIDDLCERYALAVALTSSGEIYISPINEYRDFHRGWVTSREFTQLTPIIPSHIVIAGKRIINETTFSLVPIGIESSDQTDAGALKPIDELSYKPSAGWGKSILLGFSDLPEGEKRDLALKCVYKWYAWLGNKEDRRKKLPWLSTTSEIKKDLFYADDANGEPKRRQPWLEVSHVQGDGILYKNVDTSENKEHPPYSFTIDYDRGIVKFDTEVCKMKNYTAPTNSLIEVEPATVTIHIAHELRNNSGDFYAYSYSLGGKGKPYVHKCGDIQAYALEGVINSTEKQELDSYAKELAEKVAKKWQGEFWPVQGVYVGMADVTPWGRFKSVSWRVSEQGATTTICAGQEEIQPFLPSYKERINQTKTTTLHWPSSSALDERRKSVEQGRKASGSL